MSAPNMSLEPSRPDAPPRTIMLAAEGTVDEMCMGTDMKRSMVGVTGCDCMPLMTPLIVMGGDWGTSILEALESGENRRLDTEVPPLNLSAARRSATETVLESNAPWVKLPWCGTPPLSTSMP